MNPHAEEIVNSKLCILDDHSTIKKHQRLLQKIKKLRIKELQAKEELSNKLEQLLQEREFVESGDYKKYVESEISHLEKILTVSQDGKNKMR